MSKPRIDITYVPYHVFARGNNRNGIFFDELDRLVFLKYWREAKAQFDYRVFTYALMDNHFHFLLQMEKESSLSQLMQQVLFQYARYMNKKYSRVGHLFQGRYHSLLVDTDSYFQTVDRYIHLNPVRAGIVERPEDFKWSSYNARFQPLKKDWVDHEAVIGLFWSSQERNQLVGYKAFTNEAISKPEEWTLDQLRKTVCLGSAKFLQKAFCANRTRSSFCPEQKEQCSASLAQGKRSKVELRLLWAKDVRRCGIWGD